MTLDRRSGRLRDRIDRFRSSAFVLPAGFALGGAVAGYLMTHGAGPLVATWPSSTSALLTTIASAAMAAVGVVLSGTIVARTLASQQFGPRTLGAFERDLTMHASIGVPVSAFSFCLVALERPVEGASSVRVTALALAMITAVGLLGFLHAVGRSLHVSRVVRRISQEHLAQIERCKPSEESREDCEPIDLAEVDSQLRAEHPGVLRLVEVEELVEAARRQDLVVELLVQPGDFVTGGEPVLAVRGEPDAEEELLRCLTWATTRTPLQDLRLGFDLLSEIGLRALSPGVHDPFTALDVVDRISASFAKLIECGLPPTRHRDREGRLRVVTTNLELDGLLRRAYGGLWLHSEGHELVRARIHDRFDLLVALSERRSPSLVEIVRGAEPGRPEFL